VQDVVLRTALVVLVLAFAAWAVLSLVVVLGRLSYDRSSGRESRHAPLTGRQARRLVRRASGRTRTEWGTWRRVSALSRLARARHPAAPRLARRTLSDPDPAVARAAVRALGALGDEWAVDLLVDALRQGRGSRSRVAAELERLAPLPGPRLPALLRDWNPAVRFWGATLLARYPELAESSLVSLTWDPDANVRAAAVETLGTRRSAAAGTGATSLLGDPVWFVRVHAARAAGQLAGAEAAPTICRLLADEQWWVRTAAKDALRGMGVDAVPALLSVLAHDDGFARNGAAEVLQDIGFVDALVADGSSEQLLERIYEAGGERLRTAAEARVARDRAPAKVRAA
jgi:HEAT repeat protein